MATNYVHYYSCFIILMFFIAEGDGRWKKKDREKLKNDIEAFKVIADNIESEIDVIYDDHPDDNIWKADFANDENAPKRKDHQNGKITIDLSNHEEVYKSIIKTKVNNNNFSAESFNKIQSVSFKNDILNQVTKTETSDNWPKFEDILLEIGKRYDWKNDRWIKVKRKGLGKVVKKIDSNVYLHEKHNFKYRTVKLNRSKTRRNVVIAVTAVR